MRMKVLHPRMRHLNLKGGFRRSTDGQRKKNLSVWLKRVSADMNNMKYSQSQSRRERLKLQSMSEEAMKQ